MAQKTDARVFRQGILNKNWSFKDNQKNNEDSSFYLYKTLEIQKYLNRFFKLYKVKIHNCKIFHTNNSLQIFISFYTSHKVINIFKKRLTKNAEKLKNCYKRLHLNTKNKKIDWNKVQKTKKIKKIKNFYLTPNPIEFQEILLNSLAVYTNNKLDIFIKLQNLNFSNKLSYYQIQHLKIIFKQLKKYIKNNFFKEALNILFITISKRKSAKLIADFIAEQFKLNQLKTDQVTISRKDNYFLGFLKQMLTLLVKYEVSCVKGIKIVIKGRFNKAPRAKTVSFHFGNFALQSFNSKIDYYQSTAYTTNGTFGIKVWLSENC